MKNVKLFALVLGIVYVLMGVLGLLFPGTVVGRPTVGTDVGFADTVRYGYLFDLFAVNAISHIFHLVVGVWGLFAYRNLTSSLAFSKGVAIIFLVFAVMGLFPGLNTFFGLMPLYGNLIWFHAILASVAAYFGWGRVSIQRQQQAPVHHRR